jgi:hypothetical protein
MSPQKQPFGGMPRQHFLAEATPSIGRHGLCGDPNRQVCRSRSIREAIFLACVENQVKVFVRNPAAMATVRASDSQQTCRVGPAFRVGRRIDRQLLRTMRLWTNRHRTSLHRIFKSVTLNSNKDCCFGRRNISGRAIYNVGGTLQNLAISLVLRPGTRRKLVKVEPGLGYWVMYTRPCHKKSLLTNRHTILRLSKQG